MRVRSETFLKKKGSKMNRPRRKRKLGHYEVTFLLSRDYGATQVIQATSRKSASRKAAKLQKEDVGQFWCLREKLSVRSIETLTNRTGGRCNE